MVAKGSVEITLSDKLSSDFGKALGKVVDDTAKKVSTLQKTMKDFGESAKTSGKSAGEGMKSFSSALGGVDKLIHSTRGGLKEIDDQVKKGNKSVADMGKGYENAAVSIAKMKAVIDAEIAVLRASINAKGGMESADKALVERMGELQAASGKLNSELTHLKKSYESQVPALDKVSASTKKFETTTAQLAKSLKQYSAIDQKHAQNITNISANIAKGIGSYKQLADAYAKRATNLKESIRFEVQYVKQLREEAGANKEAIKVADDRARNLELMLRTLRSVEIAQEGATQAQVRYASTSQQLKASESEMAVALGKSATSYEKLVADQKILIEMEAKGIVSSNKVASSYEKRYKAISTLIENTKKQISMAKMDNKESVESKKTLDHLVSSLKKYEKEKEKVTKLTATAIAATKKSNVEQVKEITGLAKAAKAYDNMLSKLRNLEKAYKGLIHNLESKNKLTDKEAQKLKLLKSQYAGVQSSLKKLSSGHIAASNSTKKMTISTTQLSQAMMLAGGSMSRISYGLTALASIGPQVAAGLGVVIAAMAAFKLAFKVASEAVDFFKENLKASINEFSEFERMIMGAVAVTGEGASTFYEIGDAARKVAIDFTFSSKEIAKGFITLGQAGFSAKESLSAIRSVAELAQATFSSLASSSDLMTTSIRAFDLEVTDSDRVAQLFAATINNSKTTLDGLRTAFNYVGVSAHQIGISLEQTAAALGTLNNAGLKASTAATGLRGIFGKLLAPTAKFRKELEKVGLTVEDVDPRVHGLSATLRTLRDAGFDVQSAYSGLDKRIAASATALIANVDAFDQLGAKITGTSDATVNAALQMSTLAGKTAILKNTLENLHISIGDELSPSLKDLADKLTYTLNNNQDLIESFTDLSNVVLNMANVLLDSFNGIGEKSKLLQDSMDVLHTSVSAILKSNPITSPFGIGMDYLRDKMSKLVKESEKYEKTTAHLTKALQKQVNTNKILKTGYRDTIDILRDVETSEQDRLNSIDMMVEALKKQGESEEVINGIRVAQMNGIDDLIAKLEELRLKREEQERGANFDLYVLSITSTSEALGSLVEDVNKASVAMLKARQITEGVTVKNNENTSSILDAITVNESYRGVLQNNIATMDAVARQSAINITALENEAGGTELLLSKIRDLQDLRVNATNGQRVQIDLTLEHIKAMSDSELVHLAVTQALIDTDAAYTRFKETLSEMNLDIDTHSKLFGEARAAYLNAKTELDNLNASMSALAEAGGSGSTEFMLMETRVVALADAMQGLNDEFGDFEKSVESAKEIMTQFDKDIAESARTYAEDRKVELFQETEKLRKEYESRLISYKAYQDGMATLDTKRSELSDDQTKHRAEFIIDQAESIIEKEKAALQKRLDNEKKYNKDVLKSAQEYHDLFMEMKKKERDAVQDLVDSISEKIDAFRKLYDEASDGMDSSADSISKNIEKTGDTYNKVMGKNRRATDEVRDSYSKMIKAESRLNDATQELNEGIADLNERFPEGKRNSQAYIDAVDRLKESAKEVATRSNEASSATASFGSTLAKNKDKLNEGAYNSYANAIRGVGSSMSGAKIANDDMNRTIKEGSKEALSSAEKSLGGYQKKVQEFSKVIATADKAQVSMIAKLKNVGISIDGNIDKFAKLAEGSTQNIEKIIGKLGELRGAADVIELVIKPASETDSNLNALKDTLGGIKDLASVDIEFIEDAEFNLDKVKGDFDDVKSEIESTPIMVPIHLELDAESQDIWTNLHGSSSGTPAKKFARGGRVGERGYGGGDRVPALLEKGEFVLRKEATRMIGEATLRQMNSLSPIRMAKGGVVSSPASNTVNRFAAIDYLLLDVLKSFSESSSPKLKAGVDKKGTGYMFDMADMLKKQMSGASSVIDRGLYKTALDELVDNINRYFETLMNTAGKQMGVDFSAPSFSSSNLSSRQLKSTYASILDDLANRMSSSSDVEKFARGGRVGRRGYGGGDRVPALLEEGEFVLRKEAVRKLGVDKLTNLNEDYHNNKFVKMAFGGFVRGLGVKDYVKEIVDTAVAPGTSKAVELDIEALMESSISRTPSYLRKSDNVFVSDLSEYGPEKLFKDFDNYKKTYDLYSSGEIYNHTGAHGLFNQINDYMSVINGYFLALRDNMNDSYGVKMTAPRIDYTTTSSQMEKMHDDFLAEAARKLLDQSPVTMMAGGQVPGGDSVASAAQNTLAKLVSKMGMPQTPLGQSVQKNEVPALLERGEFVLNKEVVRRLGLSKLRKLNEGQKAWPKYHDGGLVQTGGSQGGATASEIATSNLNLQMDVTFKTLDQSGAEDFVQNMLMPEIARTYRLKGDI